MVARRLRGFKMIEMVKDEKGRSSERANGWYFDC